MRSLRNLRQKLVHFREVFGSHVCKTNERCLSSKNGPLCMTVLARNNTKPSPLVNTMSYSTLNGNVSNVKSLNLYLALNLISTKDCKQPNFYAQVKPVLPVNEVIDEDVMIDGSIIGYDPTQSDVEYKPTEKPSLSCSNLLKKRKKKMNKHKYKKRRKRDKFKRRNLENIKERKKRAREKADERAKQALV